MAQPAALIPHCLPHPSQDAANGVETSGETGGESRVLAKRQDRTVGLPPVHSLAHGGAPCALPFGHGLISRRERRLEPTQIVHGRQISAEEVEARFDAVEGAEVNALARELLAGERGLCVLGPLDADAVRLRRPNAV